MEICGAIEENPLSRLRIRTPQFIYHYKDIPKEDEFVPVHSAAASASPPLPQKLYYWGAATKQSNGLPEHLV
jgi:hypothetical protein